MYVGDDGDAHNARLCSVIGWRRKYRRHPVRSATRQSAVDCLALKLVHRRRRDEAYAIVQAIHIDHCAHALCHLGDCGNEDAATTTDEEIARPGAELVAFNQRPVVRLEFEQSLRVRHHTWTMAAAERARAGANWSFLRRPCQPKARVNVAAVASAPKFHVMSFGTGCRSVNAPPILSQRHLAMFLLAGEIAHGSRWEQEGEHATY